MQISQIQVSNDILQDRLLLRILTKAQEEIRVHLTRRFVREVWPALVGMLQGHLAAVPTQSAAEAAAKGQQGNGNFDQPYQDRDLSFPLGSNPLLASEAVLEHAGPGMGRLMLREGRERCFSMNLNHELLQALCSMLRAGSDKADWGLTLEYRTATERPSASTLMPTAGQKSRLH